MKKIAYLIGAGASRGALPLVDEIPGRLRELRDILKKEEFQLSDQDTSPQVPDVPLLQLQNSLIHDLEWLADRSEGHASVDTFAKKLFIREEVRELSRLKSTLSSFFSLEQLRKQPDPRYDAFLASILKESHHSLPPDLTILSWNYDSQFEIAYGEFSGDKRLDSSRNLLQVVPKFYRRNTIDLDQFSVFKLNGTAAIYNSDFYNIFDFVDDFSSGLTREILGRIVTWHAIPLLPDTTARQGLSFSWETDFEKGVVAMAHPRMLAVEVLVIIGYSFPYFNRETDRQLIGAIRKLEKIYVQSGEVEAVIERMGAIRSDLKKEMFVPIHDLKQFVIPNEM